MTQAVIFWTCSFLSKSWVVEWKSALSYYSYGTYHSWFAWRKRKNFIFWSVMFELKDTLPLMAYVLCFSWGLFLSSDELQWRNELQFYVRDYDYEIWYVFQNSEMFILLFFCLPRCEAVAFRSKISHFTNSLEISGPHYRNWKRSRSLFAICFTLRAWLSKILLFVSP